MTVLVDPDNSQDGWREPEWGEVWHDHSRRFLDRLTAYDPPGAVLSWQTFDDAKLKRDHLAQIRHGTLDELWREMVELNDAGAGVFVMVNAGDGKGRADKRVTAVRALFADLDGAPLQPVLDARPAPHLVCETSAGRFSAFWLLRPAAPDKARFKVAQQAIARRFRGDPAVNDLARVMRVPGFWHRKREPAFLSRLLIERHQPAYRLAEVVDGLQLVQPARAAAAIATRASTAAGKRDSNFGRRVLIEACSRIRSAGAGAQRTTLNRESFSVGSLVQSAGISDREALDWLIDAAHSMTNHDASRPWTAADAEHQVKAAFADGKAHPRDSAMRDGLDEFPEIPQERPAPKPNGAAEQRPLVQLFDPTTLVNKPVPPRQWLVGDWIPIGGTTLLGGDGAAGKSLLAQQLQTCCATGKRWLDLPTLKCRGIYWPCEDDQDELHRRQADINKALGIGFTDLADMRWEARSGLDNLLMVFDGNGAAELTALFLEMERQAISFAARLAILDTAADVFGGNENIRPEVRRFIADCLNRMARAINGSVLLCIHPSRAGLATGEGDGASTAWNNTARSRIYLTRPDAEGDQQPEETARVLRRRKANFAARDEIRLHWRDGIFVNDEPPAGMLGAIAKRTAETVFLEALAKLSGRNVRVTASPAANNYAPTVMIKQGLAGRYRKRDLTTAMHSLFESGRLESQPYGPPSKQSFKLAEVTK